MSECHVKLKGRLKMSSVSIIGIIPLLFSLIVGCLSIYCLILFILVAQRGIKALDIYINEKLGGSR